jgi:hypothetical protein
MAGINRKHDEKLVFETSEDVKGTDLSVCNKQPLKSTRDTMDKADLH